MLLRADLAGSYDQVRADVVDWDGPSIASIPEILSYRPVQS
ncbi:hypothetical protein [Microlunatus soli]|nr:hypothetical protein [Microlunatus soli]